MYTKIHKFNLIAALVVSIIGSYLFISSGDAAGKFAGKALLIAGMINQLYHSIAWWVMSRSGQLSKTKRLAELPAFS